jgi:hypothetical protein|tara:strand:- start:185 stop:409 length:225 start_codon:yes stop_codon:yes gene_type:complete
MGIYQKISALFSKKQKIEKEIATLQKACKHNNRSVKSIREHVDSSQSVIRWVCDDCFKVIGFPSSIEINNFFKE